MAPPKTNVAEGGETPVSMPAVTRTSSSTQLLGSILRLVAVLLTLIATIVMGAARETVIIDVNSDYSLEGKVKSTYNSSFVYFIIVNALVCVYSAVSAGVSFINKNSSASDLPIGVADVAATVFLFTGNAAATAVEIVAEKGNSHFGWSKFCNYTDNFCHRLTAAIVLSTIAAVAYALLLVLSMTALQSRSR